MSDIPVAANSPVKEIPGEVRKPLVDLPGLCLSGGGYRAMVFHIGVLWRLYEVGMFGKDGIARISSVSGGSITAAFLGLVWNKLAVAAPDIKGKFVPHFVDPLRALAGETIDEESVIFGVLLPGTVSDRIASAYDDALFKGATLQDLPDAPRFVINATNVQSGVLWRFSKPFMRDYRVGEVKNPTVPLARAVAAASAFPPVLSPCDLRLKDSDFTPNSGMDLQRPPFTTKVVLTDGGVYDNMGLETVWKSYKTVLVSDAGGKMQAEEEPKRDWAQHAYRVLNMIDSQVRALRTRQVIDSFTLQASKPDSDEARKGAYWGIRTDIANYKLPDALPCPHARTMELAGIATRLKRLDDETQNRLINWGYAVCDAALRAHVNAALPRPAGFPYPASAV
ncbi:patatin-like phospholipase family protein [Rhodopseudomonas sp. P2A-2r]|uniref:patatin-like phospholipase family protein n=1 Tax=unclassified Rhodopseudomonas TaxID=2638247 RepID=UPI002234525D|nr:patatin-like phospholipase family protein [Rhodopseudomonas sp. P2A-2r]UZE47640.1 patatin-like phospholipase family protein [Rhodopseudomonas sp. P2A-2r]